MADPTVDYHEGREPVFVGVLWGSTRILPGRHERKKEPYLSRSLPSPGNQYTNLIMTPQWSSTFYYYYYLLLIRVLPRWLLLSETGGIITGSVGQAIWPESVVTFIVLFLGYYTSRTTCTRLRYNYIPFLNETEGTESNIYSFDPLQF